MSEQQSSVIIPKIQGLTAVKVEANEIIVRLKDTPKLSFRALLSWLPTNWEVHFYDQYYPSMSDPGAYVCIHRRDDLWLYKMGNHGWSSDWARQSPELLAAWMYLNLEARSPFSPPIDEIILRRAALKTSGS